MNLPDTAAVSPSLSIALFGRMQVSVRGLPLPHLRSRQSLWLLALLTLRHPQPLDREWLAGTLWPDSEQSRALANLRVALSELRNALGTESNRLLSPTRNTLSLDLGGADVDVHTFDAAIANGQPMALERAVTLYRGPLLQSCMEEWVVSEREAREQDCFRALQELAEAALSQGRYETSIGYYQRAIRLDSIADTPRRGWMEALASSGNTNAALHVYRQFRDELRRDDPLATPDEQTTSLYSRLRTELRKRAGAHATAPTEIPPRPPVKGYVPRPITEVVGRGVERLAVAARLLKSRLVTLTGMGGIGKTRLALAIAEELRDKYTDGAWVVTLESLTESEQVPAQVATVLGIREETGRSLVEVLADHLRGKRPLLVLDNCEHVLEAASHLVGRLLLECEGVHILATSREPLGITGERVWGVAALAVPDLAQLPADPSALLETVKGYAGVVLFVERAQSAHRSFVLDEKNAWLVAQVCSRVEGIPLALELAATRVKALTLDQIISRLDDELTLLTGANRAALSRQQTMRATLDWSYALLSDAGRLLLGRLSVFAGGWTLEAAEAVCGSVEVWKCGSKDLHTSRPPDLHTDVLAVLGSLVEKSLVVFEVSPGESDGRYRLLEIVRQYAAERLAASGEAERIKRRHQDWCIGLAEEAEPQLRGPNQETWSRRLESEYANLRAALAWSATCSDGEEAGLRLAGAMWFFWHLRGRHVEGWQYLKQALDRDETRHRTHARAKASDAAGTLAYLRGDYPTARNLHEESLTISRELGDKRGIAWALRNLGILLHSDGDQSTARALSEESLALFREIGDTQGIAWAQLNLGNIAQHEGDYERAGALHEETLRLFQELGDRQGIALTLDDLGSVAQLQGDFAAAQSFRLRGLNELRELGDKHGIIGALIGLGVLALANGNYADAHDDFGESLILARELSDSRGVAESLAGLAEAHLHTGGAQKTVCLWTVVHTLRESISAPLSVREQRKYEDHMGIARADLGEFAFASVSEMARTMTVEQAADLALATGQAELELLGRLTEQLQISQSLGRATHQV